MPIPDRGDFNSPPEGLEQYHWDGLVKCEMLVPRDTPTTCHLGEHSSLTDYAIASPHMGRMVEEVRACWDVPTRPHIGVIYTSG